MVTGGGMHETLVICDIGSGKGVVTSGELREKVRIAQSEWVMQVRFWAVLGRFSTLVGEQTLKDDTDRR